MSLHAVSFACCTKCIPPPHHGIAHAAAHRNCLPMNCSAAAIRFNGMFQRVTRREGFMEVYRAAQQQDIDNFVQFVGPAMSYPPAFSTPAYNVPGIPHGYHPSHIAQPVNLAQLQPPQPQSNSPQPGRKDRPHAKGNRQQQQQAQPMQGDAKSPHSNIVPFRRVSSPSNPNMPGGVAGYFVDEAAGQDTRPILLFDLNGTLTSHTAAKRSSGRSLMRPGIQHLRRLQVSRSRQLVHPTYNGLWFWQVLDAAWYPAPQALAGKQEQTACASHL